MIKILLYITGISILLCGAAIALIMYLSRQEFINGLSSKYLSDYNDSDMIPNDIVISMFGALIRHVLLILFAVVLIETSGASLLVVASVI